MAAVQLNIKATPVFYANLKAYQQGYPIIVNEGSSRSSKSYSLMQLMVYIAINEPGKRISVVSHSLPHVKRGVYRDFRVIMADWHQWNEERWRATDFVYYFENGSYIELIGLDDESRARGPGRDILWLNEANLIRRATFDQLAMRTTGTIFADLNPADFQCYWYEIADHPKNKKIHSTYKHNLPNLSKQQIDILEGYKHLPDPFMYNVYTLGLRGANEEIIFRGWQLYDDDPPAKDIAYGLDFGYVHPAAMVRAIFYEGAVYLRQVIYAKGLTMTELAQRVLDVEPGRWPIYADAAEPKSIEELYRMGCNVHSADKDDVWATIMKLKSMPIYLHRDSADLIREFQSYKWMKDKNDKIEERPVKDNDDLIDASRYCVFTHLNKTYVSV